MANPSGRTFNAIGLMSGTSLDGIDVSLVRTDGESIFEFGGSRTYPYNLADRSVLRKALDVGPSLKGRTERPQAVQDAERVTTERHAAAIEEFLKEFELTSDAIDLVGFHGQTIFHDASRGLTIQLGDGQALADRLGITTVYDFRAADVASGGEGAPFAPAFHRAAATFSGMKLPVVFLNIGGVANVTWIGEDGALISFDTGPGNALIDDWVRTKSGLSFDKDGQLARAGKPPQEDMMTRWLEQSYFSRNPPKSLDRNDFDVSDIESLSVEDGARFLTSFTARSIAKARDHFPVQPRQWVLTGGGRLNTYTVSLIEGLLDAQLVQAEEYGLDGDAIEAQAFALLAARALRGLPLSYPGTTGVAEPLRGGIIAEPDISRK